MTGAELITAERDRQLKEGWTIEEDKRKYGNCQLGSVAGCYLANAINKLQKLLDTEIIYTYVKIENGIPEDAFPWDKRWDKREKHGIIRSLEIAGALIAAEIDRLQNVYGYTISGKENK